MLRFTIVWFLEWIWCLSNIILKPRKLTYKKGFSREIKCNTFDHKAYEEWVKTSFRINSNGYVLSCEKYELPNAYRKEEKKVAILCHGFGCAKYQSIKYAQLFIKLGYIVLNYDHRNHGMSGKAHTTMGYYEKYDLKSVVSWCKKEYGEECKIVTHGESMGAATVLLHSEIDKRIDCVIADCAYSDLKKLLRHQMKQFFHLPKALIPIENLLIYLRAGFWFEQVSPIHAVKNSELPVLFIHGKRDNFVPASMSIDMYRAKKKNKALYLVGKAKHAESYCINSKGYEEKVSRFLKRYIK